MKFIIKSCGSTLFGFIGGYLGDFVGLWTSLFLGFTFSVVGWYLTKNWIENL